MQCLMDSDKMIKKIGKNNLLHLAIVDMLLNVYNIITLCFTNVTFKKISIFAAKFIIVEEDNEICCVYV